MKFLTNEAFTISDRYDFDKFIVVSLRLMVVSRVAKQSKTRDTTVCYYYVDGQFSKIQSYIHIIDARTYNSGSMPGQVK